MKVEDQADAEPGQLKKRDELYESAVDIVVREGRGSVSLLQRALGIGYGRAARLIDYMAEDNVVGAYAGSQAREVLITVEDWEKMQGASENDPLATTSPKPRRSNKILPSPDWDEEDKDDEQFEDEEEEEEDDDEDDEDDEEYDEDNEAEDNDEDARDEEGDEDLDEEESGLGAAGGRRDGGSVRRKAEGA
jgi:S-DNA-T family DNA segregation ATPase FtsK/SpoIIIE